MVDDFVIRDAISVMTGIDKRLLALVQLHAFPCSLLASHRDAGVENNKTSKIPKRN